MIINEEQAMPHVKHLSDYIANYAKENDITLNDLWYILIIICRGTAKALLGNVPCGKVSEKRGSD